MTLLFYLPRTYKKHEKLSIMKRLLIFVLFLGCSPIFGQLNFQNIHLNLPNSVRIFSSTVSPSNQLYISGVKAPFDGSDVFLARYNATNQYWVSIPNSIDAPNYIYSIEANTNGLFVNVNGTIIRTQDEGQTWDSIIPNSSNFRVMNMFQDSSGQISMNGIDLTVPYPTWDYYTYDNATNSWTLIHQGPKKEAYEYFFVGSDVFKYVMDSNYVSSLHVSGSTAGPWTSVNSGINSSNFMVYEIFTTPHNTVYACIKDRTTTPNTFLYLELDQSTNTWSTVNNPYTTLPPVMGIFEVEQIGNDYVVVVDSVVGQSQATVFSTALDLSSNEIESPHTDFYFNSVDNTLSVLNPEAQTMTIEVFDYNGRLLHNYSSDEATIQIDLSSNSKGCFVLKCQSANKAETVDRFCY